MWDHGVLTDHGFLGGGTGVRKIAELARVREHSKRTSWKTASGRGM